MYETEIMNFDPVSEDIFICGQCKIAFSSLQLFLEHKREPCHIINTCEKDVLDQNTHGINSGITDSLNVNAIDDIKSKHTSSAEFEEIKQGFEQISHTETDKVNENVVCTQCNKSFKKFKSLAVHLKIHSGEKPYQCPICGRCFVLNAHLQRHLLSHKVWPDGLTDTTVKSVNLDLLSYSCSYCDMVLSNYSQFRIHLKKHYSEKKFKCVQTDCLCLFDTIEKLLEHASHAHDSLVYTCHICSYTFCSLKDIALHQQCHIQKKSNEDKRKYQCMLCDANFTKKDKLMLHLSTESHKKTCVHCNKVFASDKRLRLHLQTHKRTKAFQCNICGRGFLMKKYLTTHMFTHSDRQFKCSTCDKTFKRKDLLSRHLRCHQSKKKILCPFKEKLGCALEFSRKDNLKLHINYHMKRMIYTPKQTKTKKSAPSTVEIVIVPVTSK